MFRGRHLSQIENLLQMTDAQGVLCQQMDDPQTRLIAQTIVNLDEAHALHTSYGNMPVKECLARSDFFQDLPYGILFVPVTGPSSPDSASAHRSGNELPLIPAEPESHPTSAPSPPASSPAVQPANSTLSEDEQMALFEAELKEKDWGHQPC